MIIIRKVTRSLTAVMPGWLIVICGVCLCSPVGPAGRVAVHRRAVPGSARESPPGGKRVEGRQVAPRFR